MKPTKRELLAALAHRQWSGWMTYLFANSTQNPDGSVTIPAALAERWQRQLQTDYADLPEPEKTSDRAQADRVLQLLQDSPD